jgi:hypothetical protein
MKHRLILGFISICFIILNANAQEIDVDIFGLTYHIDGGASYADAPRGLDSRGQWVYNPGFGLSYDFREDISQEGFSLILSVAYFQDCYDELFYYGGAGMRYRKYLENTDFMWEANLIGAQVNALNVRLMQRKTFLIPAYSLGIGYRFAKDYLIKANFTYVPATTDVSAISSSDLIFMQMSLCF